MRVAALYDIHGNLPALDAVLADIREHDDVDLILVGGDVLPGPMPQETMARLMTLDRPVRCIHGNGDRVVLACVRGEPIDEVPARYRDAIAWTAARLDAASRRSIGEWPPTCTLAIDGLGDVLFCHATPRNDVDCFTRTSPDARVARLFDGCGSSLVVCGHTHMQFDRVVAGVRIVNAGSVGAPFSPPAGAHWLRLGPDVQLCRTPYDVVRAARDLAATGYPLVEETAIRYVLDPPAEADSLQLFAPADAR